MFHQHMSWQQLSISRISQLLLTRFWWNFKGRFLGTSRTESNCHRGICPCNICPDDNCPYQEYLSCYWPNVGSLFGPTFFYLNFLDQNFLGPNFFWPKIVLDPTLLGLKFFGLGLFLDQKVFGPNFFWQQEQQQLQQPQPKL